MSRRKILIVDDDTDILTLVEKRLSIEGFEVLAVSRGREVIHRVAAFKPQVILMDIMMDDMDGADVVRQLQADKTASAIPVIFLSGGPGAIALEPMQYQFEVMSEPVSQPAATWWSSTSAAWASLARRSIARRTTSSPSS